MYFVVTESLKTDGGTADIDTSLQLTFDRPGGCPVEEVGQAHVKGRFTNNGGIIKFQGSFKVPYTDVCCRCLEELKREIDGSLEATFMRGNPDEVTDEEIYVYEGSKLTLGKAVEDAFILELPYRDYCESECQNDSAIAQEV